MERKRFNAVNTYRDDYSVILVDPPWSYRKFNQTAKRHRRTAASHYSGTMSFQELVDMRPFIDSLAAPNCAMFMWSTPPMLDESVDLIRAWKFRYVTWAFVFVKLAKKHRLPVMGMGSYARANAEPCLLAVRGKMPTDDNSVGQVMYGYRGVGKSFSRKPLEQYDRIQRMYPTGHRIELFARHHQPGWDAYGDEL